MNNNYREELQKIDSLPYADRAKKEKELISVIVEDISSQLLPLGTDICSQVLGNFFAKDSTPELLLIWTEAALYKKYIESNTFVQLEKIHDYLVKHKHTQKNEYEFNDADDWLSFLPTKTKNRKAYFHRTQNFNLLFAWKYQEDSAYNELHIRRVWKDFKLNLKDEYDVMDAEEYKNKGITWAIRKSDYLKDEYSDCIENNPYPHRLNLKSYIENDYFPQYRDFRDKGFVISYTNGGKLGTERPGNLAWITLDCIIPSAVASFENEDEN